MSDLASVIVVNWNGRAYLERCLPALAGQTYPAVEMIVVDNGSSDDSVAWLRARYPQVRLIGNADNRGFAPANNQGIRAAAGEYVALLNNDTWAEPGWLQALVSALAADPGAGMAASQMIFADRPNVINSTGVCVDRCGISWDRWGGWPAQPADAPRAEVFGASAGAALYRRAMLEDVGLLDERFFAYLEDVDLAWRARWRGWRAVYVPAARVYHAGSGSFREGSALKAGLLARNKIWLILKNYPWPQMAGMAPFILAYEALSLGFAFRRGHGWSALRGRWHGWRAWRPVWEERRRLMAQATVTPGQMFRALEPAVWPWRVLERVRHVTGA